MTEISPGREIDRRGETEAGIDEDVQRGCRRSLVDMKMAHIALYNRHK
jgi:hypothetical protein